MSPEEPSPWKHGHPFIDNPQHKSAIIKAIIMEVRKNGKNT
ncbi:MAG: hypothetical protein K0S80_3999 [Neobacillus sp.]|nr:hypothetical protein [Neobacillus sp.]